MSIEIRDNTEKRIACVINKALSLATDVRIAVAFLKYSGIRVIEKTLNSFLGKEGNLKIIVGLDFFTTEPAAIQYFLKLKEKNKNVEIRCYPIPKSKGKTTAFHPKLYLFEGGENYVTIIGSSNLTKGGLCTNMEINTVFMEKEAEHYTTAQGIFDKMWKPEHTSEITKAIIEKYKKAAKAIKEAKKNAENTEEAKQAKKDFNTEFPQRETEQENNTIDSEFAQKVGGSFDKTPQNKKDSESIPIRQQIIQFMKDMKDEVISLKKLYDKFPDIKKPSIRNELNKNEASYSIEKNPNNLRLYKNTEKGKGTYQLTDEGKKFLL